MDNQNIINEVIKTLTKNMNVDEEDKYDWEQILWRENTKNENYKLLLELKEDFGEI